MKLFKFILILGLCYSCREGTIYTDLSIEEKKSLLFYIPDNYKFKMICNEKDTINIIIANKTIIYDRLPCPYGSKGHQKIYLEFINNNLPKDSNIIGNISYYAENEASQQCDSNFFAFGSIKVDLIKGNGINVNVNNKLYSDVYLLQNISGTDNAYTNKEYGLIKIWNDTLKYERIP